MHAHAHTRRLVVAMLQHDPARRPTAERVLGDVLFGGGGASGATAHDDGGGEGSGECVICMEEVPSCAIVHPGQVCGGCCLSCARALMERGGSCPRCQQPITEVRASLYAS